MTTKVFLLKREALKPGEVTRVELSGCPLAVYNVEGRFYATHDICTHATASLSEGEIVDGDLIAWPVHDGTFHIPSGQAMGHPCTVDLRTYRVFEDAEDVYVDLESEAEEASSAI